MKRKSEVRAKTEKLDRITLAETRDDCWWEVSELCLPCGAFRHVLERNENLNERERVSIHELKEQKVGRTVLNISLSVSDGRCQRAMALRK